VSHLVPERLLNFIGGRDVEPSSGAFFEKRSPVDGSLLCMVARSEKTDALAAVATAKAAQLAWDDLTPVARGTFIRQMAIKMTDELEPLTELLALETGRSKKDARGELNASIESAFFYAGEGRRFYGRTTSSAIPNRTAATVRQALGVAALIIAPNTPVSNFAWKVFPALLCGNTVVLKPSEDAPITATVCARMFAALGLPPGVLNVVQGHGEDAGAPLVESPDVALVSFTGSVEVGRYVQRTAGARLAKVCLELGGKNPFIVCDDADLELAVGLATTSAFGMAGQRCASGSRLLVFDRVYDEFKSRLVDKARALRLGVDDSDDLGPVITQGQLDAMLASVQAAQKSGAHVLVGGERFSKAPCDKGYFMAPTVIEGSSPDSALSRTEVFGPVTSLYRVRDAEDAVRLANSSDFGLTAAVHTKSTDRALWFTKKLRAGVVSINGATFGSEPHMPFGGLRSSGTGWREAGTEALDFYSDLKTIYSHFDPTRI
jgi:alpha-ketoglutaric semialdehyde dehydrogenase